MPDPLIDFNALKEQVTQALKNPTEVRPTVAVRAVAMFVILKVLERHNLFPEVLNHYTETGARQ